MSKDVQHCSWEDEDKCAKAPPCPTFPLTSLLMPSSSTSFPFPSSSSLRSANAANSISSISANRAAMAASPIWITVPNSEQVDETSDDDNISFSSSWMLSSSSLLSLFLSLLSCSLVILFVLLPRKTAFVNESNPPISCPSIRSFSCKAILSSRLLLPLILFSNLSPNSVVSLLSSIRCR